MQWLGSNLKNCIDSTSESSHLKKNHSVFFHTILNASNFYDQSKIKYTEKGYEETFILMTLSVIILK